MTVLSGQINCIRLVAQLYGYSLFLTLLKQFLLPPAYLLLSHTLYFNKQIPCIMRNMHIDFLTVGPKTSEGRLGNVSWPITLQRYAERLNEHSFVSDKKSESQSQSIDAEWLINHTYTVISLNPQRILYTACSSKSTLLLGWNMLALARCINLIHSQLKNVSCNHRILQALTNYIQYINKRTSINC